MKWLFHAVEQCLRHPQPQAASGQLVLCHVEALVRMLELAALHPKLSALPPLLGLRVVVVGSVDELLDPLGVLGELRGVRHF